MKKLILITILFTVIICVHTQEFSRTKVGFSIQDSNSKLLRFSKELNAQMYKNMSYRDINYSTEKVRKLSHEIIIIENLWNAAKDSVFLDLNSISVGYPLQFKDVLQKQIEVFSSSPKWQKYTFYRKNNDIPSWKIDHELIEGIMFENRIYGELDEVLNKFGYEIKGFSVEKIGYVTQKDIDKYDLNIDKEKYKDVPIPFMVWIMVEKITEK